MVIDLNFIGVVIELMLFEWIDWDMLFYVIGVGVGIGDLVFIMENSYGID